MKVNGLTIRKMAREYKYMKMVVDMTGSGKKESIMDTEG